MTESKIYVSEGLTYPFDTPDFINTWGLWLEHRKEISKPIKGKISQQAALKKIATLASGKEEKAIAIIHQSLENNWRGLFEIKTDKRNEGTTDNADLAAALAKRYGA